MLARDAATSSQEQQHQQQGRRLFNATSSEVILESRGEASSVAFDFELHPSARSTAPAAPMLTHSHVASPLIRVQIRRARLVGCTLALVAAIAALMWLCSGDGLFFESFVSTSKDDRARKQLLDKYNSLSGNVVSVLIKPLEYFVALALPLALLCFATEFTLGPHTQRYQQALLVLAAATGYLLTTGFNAINVQLVPNVIHAVVSARDLSLSATGDAILDIEAPALKRAKAVADHANRSLVEEAARNPITNTVFHNWALALEVPPRTQCVRPDLDSTSAPRSVGVSALYRIPGRSWYSEALPTALEPAKQLKFVAEYPAIAARVAPGTPVELPMPRNRAVKLLVDAVHNADRLFFYTPGWEKFRSTPGYNAQSAFRRKFGDQNNSAMADTEFPALVDLLLQDAREARGAAPLSDADVLQVMANMTLETFSPGGVRGPTVGVELSHFDLSDNLTFDAVTLEFPSRRGFLEQRFVANASAPGGFDTLFTAASAANASTSGDVYFELDALTRCSLSGCALLDAEKSVKPQVFAFRACEDDPERDATRFKYIFPFSGNGNIICSNRSNSSLMIVSVGVRIEGDEIAHGSLVTGNSSRQLIRLKNARKVYSLTVGRLSWETVNLAKVYGAKCAGDDPSLCRGTRYKLAHSEGSKRRHVLVSSKRMPIDALSDYYYHFNDVDSQYLPLVELPATQSSILSNEDMVLPRRFRRSSLPRSSDAASTACSPDVEDLLYHTEMNHLYIEKSLQPAYAAAVFFLFQDGVVRDEVDDGEPADVDRSPGSELLPRTVTLGFLNNRQDVHVRLTSPLLNIVLTLVGCGFLLALAFAVAVAGKSSVDKLERLADAHNVVEMLVDTAKYPSALLEKTIVSGTPDDAEAPKPKADAGAAGGEPLDENVRVKRVMLARQSDVADGNVDKQETTPAAAPAVV